MAARRPFEVMRVAVTGAAGMLGSEICAVFAAHGHEVVAWSHADLDVTDLPAVRELVHTSRPGVLIHAAADTDVDAAERDPDLAMKVNAIGTANVAMACAEAGTDVAYVSSCGVFDGRKAAPYTELDEPNPVTQHHRSKVRGERAVLQLPRSYVLRPGWLFGGAPAHRKNFVAGRWREASTSSTIRSASDRFGSPTWTRDFAEATHAILQARAYGTYHVANAGFASRYDYVKACVELLGLPSTVTPVGSDAFPRPAPVPHWEALDAWHLRIRGLPSLPPWRTALETYIRTRFLPALEGAR